MTNTLDFSKGTRGDARPERGVRNPFQCQSMRKKSLLVLSFGFSVEGLDIFSFVHTFGFQSTPTIVWFPIVNTQNCFCLNHITPLKRGTVYPLTAPAGGSVSTGSVGN